MEFQDVVAQRRMVRNFEDRPVDRAVLERMLATARRGPSAGFTQGQDFVVVTRPELKQAIARLCDEAAYVAAGYDPFISRAAAVIVPCTTENAYHRRYRESDKVDDEGNEIAWPVPYWFMDVGCAVMLLLLAVVDEGLAAGFAGTQHTDELRSLLGIPAETTPVGVIPVGYPAVDKRSTSLKRGRRPQAEQVRFEHWSS